MRSSGQQLPGRDTWNSVSQRFFGIGEAVFGGAKRGTFGMKMLGWVGGVKKDGKFGCKRSGTGDVREVSGIFFVFLREKSWG